jgi:hypothetical protein
LSENDEMPIEDLDEKREYQRRWVALRRSTFFLDKICVRCGNSHNLELHHRNKEDKISHRIWSWSWIRIYEEVSKCDILCHNCHLGETNKHKGGHGTRSMYRSGCKCRMCAAWKRASR